MSSNRRGKVIYSTEEIIRAIESAHGGIFIAAEKIGCSYKTIERRAKEVQAVRDAIEKWRGRRVDVAELALDRALANGEAWAVMFVARTLGKRRGYVERQEVTGEDGGAVTLKILRDVSMDDL
jgi:hypothetical protein